MNKKAISISFLIFFASYMQAQDLCPSGGITNIIAGDQENIIAWSEPFSVGGIGCGDFVVNGLPYYNEANNVGTSDDWPVIGSQGADIAYTFNVTQSITIDVNLCAVPTNYDCKLEIFTNDETCLNPVSTGYYSDDGPDCALETPDQTYEPSSITSATLEPGQYYIVVDGYSGATGNHGINITQSTQQNSIATQNTVRTEWAIEQFKMADQGVSQEEIDEYDEEVNNPDRYVYRTRTTRDVPEECGTFSTYRLYNAADGSVVGETTDLSYTHGSLTNDTTYCYYVTVVYTEGESVPSDTVCATPETFVVYSPTNLGAQVGDEEILTSWTPPDVPQLAVPYVEGFDPGGLVDLWQYEGNWSINNTSGNPAPSMYFNWTPQDTNYSHSLYSPAVPLGTLTEATVSYDYTINDFASQSAAETLTVEYRTGTQQSWNFLQEFISSETLPWNTYSHDLTGLTNNLQVRFHCHGDSTYNINWYNIDNFSVDSTITTPSRDIYGSSITAINYYQPNSTANLVLQINYESTDYEFIDSISITFPDSFRVNSASNIGNLILNSNTLVDQTITWGDFNVDGPSGELHETTLCTLNVTVGDIIGYQNIPWAMYGDGYGGGWTSQFGTLSLNDNIFLPYEFMGYNLYMGGQLVTETPIMNTTYLSSGLTNGQSYEFGVTTRYYPLWESTTNVVSASPVDLPGTVDVEFRADITDNAMTPLIVEFYDMTTVENTAVDSFLWDFGDGSTSTEEQHPIHSYADYGVYTVSLIVYGAEASDSLTKENYITNLLYDAVITEIIQNPYEVNDSEGEWFEAYNPMNIPIDLDGWTIKDAGTENHIISTSIIIEPGEYIVLGANSNMSENGGVRIDYQYSDISLMNGSDVIILVDPYGNTRDSVAYDNGATFPDPNGASMALLDPALDNSLGSNWVESTLAFGEGDLGTPGKVNFFAEMSFDAIGVFNSVTFAKEDYADWTLPENQDHFSDNVIITRRDNQGLFNIVAHDQYQCCTPYGTEWAWGPTDGTQNYIDWASLRWNNTIGTSDHITMYNNNHRVSLHLIEDDKYFDVVWHSWTGLNSGGGYSYTRVEVDENGGPILFVLGFDSVNVSESASLNLTITNNGNIPLDITSITTELPEFSILFTDSLINTSAVLEVTFTPTVYGRTEGSLFLTSNNLDTSLVEVILTGFGFYPASDIQLSESTLDYGGVIINQSEVLSISISNEGNQSLELNSLYTDSTQFTLSFADSTVDTSAFAVLELSFTPTDTLPLTDTLYILTNDPDEGLVKVPLSGYGYYPVPDIELPENYQVFDNTMVGLSTLEIFNVLNAGEAVLEIDTMYYSGDFTGAPSTSEGWVLPTTGTIDAGDTLSLEITFTPDSVYSQIGTLVIVAGNDPDEDTLLVSLIGTGIIPAPICTISDDTLDFGIFVPEQDLTSQVTIYNDGLLDLNIDISITANSGFSTTFAGATVVPGDSVIANFQFYTEDNITQAFAMATIIPANLGLNNETIFLRAGYFGPVWYVSGTGNDETGFGTQDSPLATIQKGIDMSDDGHTILVTSGLYVENINYNGKSISIIGEDRETTIIDGSQSQLASVVTISGADDTTTVLDGFTIRNGSSFAAGGGIYCYESIPTLKNLKIENNMVEQDGGGIYSYNSFIRSSNILIANNSASTGGAIALYYSDANLEHLTMIGNAADEFGGGIYSDNSNLNISNSILWGNTPDAIVGQANVMYSNIEDTIWVGDGNINASPLFCEPDSGDYTLAENSPCIGSGEDGANMGAFEVGCAAFILEPVLAEIPDTTINEDENLTLTISAESLLDYSVTYTAISDTADVQANTLDSIVILTVSDNWNGSTLITVIATDETGLSDTTDFRLTVMPVNDTPGEFNLISPEDDAEIAITPDNISDTLWFHWTRSIDIDDDPLIYDFHATSGLSVLDELIQLDGDASAWVLFSTLVETIDSVNIIVGIWDVGVTDNIDTVSAENPFTLTIDATAMAIDPSELIPDVFALHQNYPNPFNPTTQIKYDLPEDAMVRITIYDMMGRHVKTLINNEQTAGYKMIRWNATNDAGSAVSAGLYLYRIDTGQFMKTKKMVLLK